MKNPPWLLVDSEMQPEVGKAVDLDPSEARHTAGPLRRRPGDRVVLVDGAGTVAQAVIRVVEKKRVAAEIVAVRVEDPPGGEGVSVALAVIGHQAMDWAVQKLVEVGTRRLLPILTERTQAGGRTGAGRLVHWRRVGLQAIKQCRRPWAMEIADVCRLEEVVESESTGHGVVVAHPGGVAAVDLPPSAGRLLVVGPEGGFSPAEHRLFSSLEWPRVRLGAHTLRSETAAVVGAAMLVARDEGLQEVKSEE
jgi:16S rRNA (uracil1498-N3)-methyltransferase